MLFCLREVKSGRAREPVLLLQVAYRASLLLSHIENIRLLHTNLFCYYKSHAEQVYCCHVLKTAHSRRICYVNYERVELCCSSFPRYRELFLLLLVSRDVRQTTARHLLPNDYSAHVATVFINILGVRFLEPSTQTKRELEITGSLGFVPETLHTKSMGKKIGKHIYGPLAPRNLEYFITDFVSVRF